MGNENRTDHVARISALENGLREAAAIALLEHVIRCDAQMVEHRPETVDKIARLRALADAGKPCDLGGVAMIVKLPDLDFIPSAVHRNRDAIREARGAYQGAIKALEGLQKANEAMCKHPNKASRYDPGYAGGGYSHSECPDCGGHLP